MTYDIGTRVGALLGSDPKSKVVTVFGFGVYEGDYVPDGAAGFMAVVARSMQRPNPRIRLDSGDVVWGCECWWGPEATIRDKLDAMRANGWTVREVAIADARAEVTTTE